MKKWLNSKKIAKNQQIIKKKKKKKIRKIDD